MKIVICIFLLLPVLLASGCGRNIETVEAFAEPEPEINMQEIILHRLVDEKTAEISALEDAIIDYRRQIAGLERDLEKTHQNAMESLLHLPWDWTPEAIRQNLIDNTYSLPWGSLFERGLIFYYRKDSIFLGPGYALVRTFPEPDSPPNYRSLYYPDLLVVYSIIDEDNIDWEVIAHRFSWGDGFHLFPVGWPDCSRNITDAESVTVRFYTVPYLEYPYFQAFYQEVELPGSDLWLSVIIEMERISGIQIWDWWYEGRRIYVNINPMHWPRFTFGTVSFMVSARAVLLTFASFPHVDEIEILFGGNRVEIDHHGTFWGHYVIGEGFPLTPYGYNTPIVGGWLHREDE
ncbi:MAG: hypothetical protein FWC73_07300 [Defluviitaleaceae bacterium]|nr:hypothetical protein [Defluviitaleaceae bacterium]